MKSKSYLFVVILTLLTFTACEGRKSNEINKNSEVAVCPNTGVSCLKDHSCCIINQEEDNDSTTATQETDS